MLELGELDRHHAEFQQRNIEIIAVANDTPELAQETQKKFEHLRIVADTQQPMAKALKVLHPGMGPDKSDTNAPTTILVDGSGTVRWLFRPDRFVERLSAEEVLAAINEAGL